MAGKVKGDIISHGLGRKTMLEAVNKYAPESKILDFAALKSIIADPEYSPTLKEKLTFSESRVIGLPLVDFLYKNSKFE